MHKKRTRAKYSKPILNFGNHQIKNLFLPTMGKGKIQKTMGIIQINHIRLLRWKTAYPKQKLIQSIWTSDKIPIGKDSVNFKKTHLTVSTADFYGRARDKQYANCFCKCLVTHVKTTKEKGGKRRGGMMFGNAWSVTWKQQKHHIACT